MKTLEKLREACRMFDIYKWAYKDDLFSKKGGEQ